MGQEELLAYIEQSREEAERVGSVVRDFRVFSFDHIPERPVIRPEVKRIVDCLVRYAQSGIPRHLVIVGPRGCGKTLTFRYLEKAFASKLRLPFFGVNCRVLRKEMGLHNPILGICVGALAGFGLASHGGGTMSALLIPYEALGIAVVLMFFLMPFLKEKKGKDINPPESGDRHVTADDPWEEEVRRGGRLARQIKDRRRRR
jgi:hypothetical protein